MPPDKLPVCPVTHRDSEGASQDNKQTDENYRKAKEIVDQHREEKK